MAHGVNRSASSDMKSPSAFAYLCEPIPICRREHIETHYMPLIRTWLVHAIFHSLTEAPLQSVPLKRSRNGTWR